MFTKKSSLICIISAVLALLIGAGCSGVLSGTVVLEYMFYDEDITSSSDLSHFIVDMASDDDWEDNSDDIRNIDQIGFQLWIDNEGVSSATPLFYIADSIAMDTIALDPDSVMAFGVEIMSGMTIPASSSLYVDYPTSIGYLKNFGTFKDIVETGKFTLYSITENLPYDLHIDSIKVIVTITF